MGRAPKQLTVIASLSAHNSDQDTADEFAWSLFCQRVQQLAASPQFADLSLTVSAEG